MECGAYKQWCGEHHAASAFGFLVGLGLLRGEIRRSGVLGGQSEAGAPGGGACRFLALYTLGDDGAKGLCLLGR